jgi:hypothetical protein
MVSSFEKNATRDSAILTLSDGTRLAVRDSVGSGGGGGASYDSIWLRRSGTVLQHLTTKDANGNGGTAGTVTADSANIFIGIQSGGLSSMTGGRDFALGQGAGKSFTTGSQNTATGWNSGGRISSGNYNTAYGAGSLLTNATGSDNTAFGNNALNANANYNFSFVTAIGSGAAQNNRVNYTTAIGYSALASNTTGQENLAIGDASLYSNTTGAANVGLGRQSLYLSNGNHNSAIGYSSLYNNTSGAGNTAIGLQANFNNTTGSYNLVIGAFVNVPTATASGQLNIGNVLYGTGLYQTASNSSTPTTAGAISIGVTAPNASAVLDLTSKTKGFLPPRMTTAEKLALTGTAGLVVYDTTLNKLCVFTTVWETITSL